MPIYLTSEQSERAMVAGAVQAEQPAFGSGGGEQARQRARRLLDGLFTDGAIAVSNQLIFEAVQSRGHRGHRDGLGDGRQQVIRRESSSEGGRR